MADDIKEVHVVVRWKARVSKYMVPEQNFMEEAVLESRVDGSLQESSDKKG